MNEGLLFHPHCGIYYFSIHIVSFRMGRILAQTHTDLSRGVSSWLILLVLKDLFSIQRCLSFSGKFSSMSFADYFFLSMFSLLCCWNFYKAYVEPPCFWVSVWYFPVSFICIFCVLHPKAFCQLYFLYHQLIQFANFSPFHSLVPATDF